MSASATAAMPILPPATLGMLGGGQLGRFFVIAARQMGYRVWVLDPDPKSPAGALADRHLCAAYSDETALGEMAGGVAAVSTEFENVPAATLEYFCKRALPVRPGPQAVAVCQHRAAEKNFLRDNGLPHAPFAVIGTAADLDDASAALFPGILKVARFGYDGKGQAVVQSRADAHDAWERFGGEACVLEQKLSLDYEVSVVLARDAAGSVQCFPVGENIHRNGILDTSIVPARMGGCKAGDAQEIAERVAAALDYVGVLGVEFFVSRGLLYVNEMAPRPHNSGHYTIDACVESQFAQQLRAMCGLPLGSPRAHSAAVMVNLLGDLWFDEHGREREPDWGALLAIEGLKLHLYGKESARPGRKMGHFTVLDADPIKAQQRAEAARAVLGLPGA